MAAQLLKHPPIYCSACHCQYPDRRHVDFLADNDQGWSEDQKTSYDNLQLCENCVKAAGALVGMVDGETSERELREKGADVDRLNRELRQARTFADNLESAFDARPEHGPIRIDHRKKPRKVQTEEVANAS